MQVVMKTTDSGEPTFPIGFELFVGGRQAAYVVSVDETSNPFQKGIEESWSIYFHHKEKGEWRTGFLSLTAAIQYAQNFFYPQG